MSDADRALLEQAQRVDALRLLRDQQRTVILDRAAGLTYEQIGQRLNLSRNRAWQIYGLAIRALRSLAATQAARMVRYAVMDEHDIVRSPGYETLAEAEDHRQRLSEWAMQYLHRTWHGPERTRPPQDLRVITHTANGWHELDGAPAQDAGWALLDAPQQDEHHYGGVAVARLAARAALSFAR